ncbi:MAG: hypothetical protein GY815_07545 [Gammaproteobacteria bacterium]|nr:hypothetical protein [Gammaproteobacteria bacterium]
MSNLIRLDIKPDRGGWRNPSYQLEMHCRSSLPFVVNSRGVLTHRVRYLTQHKLPGNRPHLAVSMWCGSGQNGLEKFTFVGESPRERMTCVRCEQMAIEAGLPSSADLAGAPVALGKVKPEFVKIIFPTMKEQLNA